MKFTVNTFELSKRLSVLSRIVSANNVIPILGSILFHVGKRLTLTSSDSEITIQTSIQMDDWDGEEFSFVSPAKLISDLMSCVPNAIISFELLRDSVIVDLPKGQYIFPSWDITKFPSIPNLLDADKTVLSANVLKQGIARTIFSMAEDPLRPIINGVYIGIEDSVSFASTDSYRISWVVGDVVSNSANRELVISSKTANLLNALPFKGVEEVTLESNAQNILFNVGEYYVYSKIVEGKFPPFKSVIPKGEMNTLTVNKSDLIGAIKRVSVFSDQSKSLIRMSIGKKIVLSAEDIDNKHKATESVSCSYEGDTVDIGFKKEFLASIVSNIELDEVTMHFTTSNKPVVFDYEHVKLVIIPLFIK